MPIEILEHTADIRLRAWGHSFPGTLLELSNSMLKLVYGDIIRPDKTVGSSLDYDSVENSVVRLLNDLLYESESLELAILVRRVTVCKRTIKWEGFGEKFAETSHLGSILVKAATYDRLKVSEVPALVEITLDI